MLPSSPVTRMPGVRCWDGKQLSVSVAGLAGKGSCCSAAAVPSHMPAGQHSHTRSTVAESWHPAHGRPCKHLITTHCLASAEGHTIYQGQLAAC